MKKVLAASLLMAFVLTGCNTFKGVGKDVSKAGDAVTNTAEKTSTKSIDINSLVDEKALSLDKVFFI